MCMQCLVWEVCGLRVMFYCASQMGVLAECLCLVAVQSVWSVTLFPVFSLVCLYLYCRPHHSQVAPLIPQHMERPRVSHDVGDIPRIQCVLEGDSQPTKVTHHHSFPIKVI